MKLFTPDLYRNFGIGFAAGVLGFAATSGADFLGAVPRLVAAIF